MLLTAESGQIPPPSFATIMEELARIPDASEANGRHAPRSSQLSTIGRFTPATGVPLSAASSDVDECGKSRFHF
jgi:hypothetical protein